VIGEDPLRGREYRHPESIEHPGDVLLLAVDAPSGTAHPPQARYRPLPVGAVLELDNEDLLGPSALLREVLDVALLLEDAAMSAFILEWGISAVSCFAICALRILVRKSAMGSLTDIFSYQLAFVTPGILPSWASSLRQILQSPNLR